MKTLNKPVEVSTDKLEFESIIADILENETVQKMKNFKQHYDTSCFEHCKNVAYYNYKICKKLGLNYKSAARAGMLHDLFLYDWRKPDPNHKGLHAFTHPRIALNNALEHFELSELEQDIILKHMWPVTLILPKHRESYIITLTDKFCALQESFKAYKSKKIFKYIRKSSYIFLGMLLFLCNVIFI